MASLNDEFMALLLDNDYSYFAFCCDEPILSSQLHWPSCTLGPRRWEWKVSGIDDILVDPEKPEIIVATNTINSCAAHAANSKVDGAFALWKYDLGD